ncbi:AIR synthase-related protein [Thermodesulfobacteriota bacterium]
MKTINCVIVDIPCLQNSCGLLVALEPDEAEDYVERLKSKGINQASIVGEFIDEHKGMIVI